MLRKSVKSGAFVHWEGRGSLNSDLAFAIAITCKDYSSLSFSSLFIQHQSVVWCYFPRSLQPFMWGAQGKQDSVLLYDSSVRRRVKCVALTCLEENAVNTPCVLHNWHTYYDKQEIACLQVENQSWTEWSAFSAGKIASWALSAWFLTRIRGLGQTWANSLVVPWQLWNLRKGIYTIPLSFNSLICKISMNDCTYQFRL